MQTIQLEVKDRSLDAILTLLNNLKTGMVRELKVIGGQPDVTPVLHADEDQKLHAARGVLRNRIADPVVYQRSLCSEGERS